MALMKKTSAAKKKKKVGAKTPAARKKAAAKTGAKGPARKKTAARSPRKKALLPRSPAAATPAENPRARALAQRIGQILSDKKALDILILDVRGMTSYADYFVVASGESDRQVSAMAESVLTQLKEGEDGLRPIGHEGMETGQWVLLDYGEVVAHLFLGEVRSFYDLEGLWADAPREKVA